MLPILYKLSSVDEHLDIVFLCKLIEKIVIISNGISFCGNVTKILYL